jgi:hypothetical protein
MVQGREEIRQRNWPGVGIEGEILRAQNDGLTATAKAKQKATETGPAATGGAGGLVLRRFCRGAKACAEDAQAVDRRKTFIRHGQSRALTKGEDAFRARMRVWRERRRRRAIRATLRNALARGLLCRS